MMYIEKDRKYKLLDHPCSPEIILMIWIKINSYYDDYDKHDWLLVSIDSYGSVFAQLLVLEFTGEN